MRRAGDPGDRFTDDLLQLLFLAPVLILVGLISEAAKLDAVGATLTGGFVGFGLARMMRWVFDDWSSPR